MPDYRDYLARSNDELGQVDPIEMNLLVAKSIPSLANLDIPRYQRLADEWVEGYKVWLPQMERHFWKDPSYFRNDINFFRLGMLHQFLETKLGIEYKEDQRNVTAIYYTDPSDLFLNGVMDTLRGTCGSMATLNMALGRRLGWPVSLTCVKSHYLCRYDDGKVVHNLEATQSGYGGFTSPPDEDLVKKYNLPRISIECGSDLRSLKPREMLGVFLWARGRHMRDTRRFDEAQEDYLLARWLYPNSRRIYIDAMALVVPYGERLFEGDELGSPISLSETLIEKYGLPRSVTGYPQYKVPEPVTFTSL